MALRPNRHISTSPPPTIGQVSVFIQALFPVRNGDISFAYHTPRIRHGSSNSFTFLNPLHSLAPASRVVLSITPTAGFYDAVSSDPAINEAPADGETDNGTASNTNSSTRKRSRAQSSSTLAFLHRPWALDRRRMPRRAAVLANHKGFDEVLTVGNNAALGARLGIDVGKAVVIQGYKGDPDRTIALVGLVGGGADGELGRKQLGVPRTHILRLLEEEFGAFEGIYGFGTRDSAVLPSTSTYYAQGGKGGGASIATLLTSESKDDDTPIQVIAIMNAFHPAEVEQVEAIAHNLVSNLPHALETMTTTNVEQPQQEKTPPPRQSAALDSCPYVLYLTGAVREPGLLAARGRDMAVVCVGHRMCEEWGIRHMARLLRERWPGLRVDEVLEDEGEDEDAGRKQT
ncbi:Nif3-like dinuclear metal center hexameric protein [Microdochium nivale]|nr:Nif3-like dinuclear metal center hexameric protein [Microdochium nivale]